MTKIKLRKCPECKKGINSADLGGNLDCFHCSVCGHVECDPRNKKFWENQYSKKVVK